MSIRHLIQWSLAPIVIIVIAFGWKYPLLGFIVPVTMISGLSVGYFKGRYFCGHFCPRGSFYDRLLSKISFKKSAPKFLTTKFFRLSFLIALCAFAFILIYPNPTNLNTWGFMFWALCTVTTFIGILLGILFHHRTWCTFCPIGTLAAKFKK